MAIGNCVCRKCLKTSQEKGAQNWAARKVIGKKWEEVIAVGDACLDCYGTFEAYEEELGDWDSFCDKIETNEQFKK